MLILPEFELLQPHTVDEAVRALAESPQDTLLLAGGTDLIPNLKQGLHTPRRVISLSKINALREVHQTFQGLTLGSGLTLEETSSHPVVAEQYPALAQAAGMAAGPQLRNRGTLGGNLCLDTRCVYYNQSHFWRQALGYCLKKDGTICHVVPGGSRCVAAFSADTPGPLILYGAVAHLQSAKGKREVSLDKFFRGDGIRNTVLEPGEILVSIWLPPVAPNFRATYQKLRTREAIDFPVLSLALGVEGVQGVLQDATAVVGGLGAKPRIINGLTPLVKDRAISSELMGIIGERMADQCHPLTNIDVDTGWRRSVITSLVRRASDAISI